MGLKLGDCNFHYQILAAIPRPQVIAVAVDAKTAPNIPNMLFRTLCFKKGTLDM